MNSGYFKSEAKKALEGKWQTFSLLSVIPSVLYIIIQGPSAALNIYTLFEEYLSNSSLIDPTKAIISDFLSLAGDLVSFFLLQHLIFGLSYIALKVSRNENINSSDLFVGLKNYGNILIVSLIKELYILLWLLLFIIPGIIKALSYSMTFFIIAEKPDIKPSEALKESEKLMEGHKWDYFVLGLSFLGWQLLSIPTLGLFSIWLDPYYYTAQAMFYQKIKSEKYGNAIPYGEDEEQYIQSPEDYITYQNSEEHETYYEPEIYSVEIDEQPLNSNNENFNE